jgi:membrane-bound lytic murein transglycosylase D
MLCIFKFRKIILPASAVLLAFTLLSTTPVSAAKAAQSTIRHQLDCSADFPCPKALRRRVDFWVDVFSRWDKNTAILHDYDQPWRVYQTIDGINKCTEKKVKRERKRLIANLNALGGRLKKDQAPKGQIQKHLAQQFDRLNSRIVYRSAKNIRCQLGVSDQFSGALVRFERYKDLISGIIDDAGMPEDLLYLPFVESSYRADSYSKVGAAGMWQIMPNTARSLGMELNAVLDERLDPEAATRGAMRYFKNSQKSLIPLSREMNPGISDAEINPFIVTSYNYGINGMRRAIKQLGPDFLKVLDEYKSSAFQVAVKNFYASFLAAGYLARNSEQYFGKTGADSALRYQTFVLPVPTSMERIKYQFDLSESQLKPLNPSLTRFAWNNWRLVPAGYRLHLPQRRHRWVTQIDTLNSLPPEPQSKFKQVYRVRKGDTACGIANAFKVKCKELIAANKLGKRATIRIGQKLDIPGRAPTSSTKKVAKADKISPTGMYRVKSGDTACGIAGRYGVACRELIRLNQLGRKAKLSVGQRLQVPGLGALVAQDIAQAASLNYTVKRGDTACEIASRYATSCTKLIAENRLGKKARLTVGQVLTIRGRSGKVSNNVSVSQYTVRSGDTACQIAERFDVPCSTLIRTNRLGRGGKIGVGQVLKITSVIGPRSTSSEISAQQKNWLDKVDTPPDMTLIAKAGKLRLTALPDETLAHYADWMGARGSASLRRLNGIKKGTEIQPGQTIVLPLKAGQTLETFKSRRSEFHLVLTEEFKERFTIDGVKTISIQSGQSLWSIARKYETPMWLLIRFNPGLGSVLQTGQQLKVAMISKKN